LATFGKNFNQAHAIFEPKIEINTTVVGWFVTDGQVAAVRDVDSG